MKKPIVSNDRNVTVPDGVPLVLVLNQLLNAAATVQVKALAPCPFREDARRIKNATDGLVKFAERCLTPEQMECIYDEGGVFNEMVLELMKTPADKWPELLAVVRCFNRGEVRRVEA